MIQAPGDANRAGVIFGLSKPKTTVQTGRKNGPGEDAWLASLDPGIARYVGVLDEAGVETFESCEGGPGHGFLEPTVRFYGDNSKGFRALTVNGRPAGDLNLRPHPHTKHRQNPSNQRSCF